MTDTMRKTIMGGLALVALGLVAGLANNLVAGPTRRLEWVKDYPDKGEPGCKKYERELAERPTGAASTDSSSVVVPAGTTPSGPVGEDVEVSAPDVAGSVEAGDSPAIPDAAPAGLAGPAPTPAPAPMAAVEIPPVPPDEDFVELAPAQVKALFDRGALFVDARRTSQYVDGHVQGALSIPIWESGVEEKVAQVAFAPQVSGDMSRPIVAYCGGGDCEDSHELARKLKAFGHEATYVYKDGFPNWRDAGWPVTKGEAP